MAKALNLWIVPVLLHVERTELPPPVRDLNPIELNELDAYLKQLSMRVRAHARKRQKR